MLKPMIIPWQTRQQRDEQAERERLRIGEQVTFARAIEIANAEGIKREFNGCDCIVLELNTGHFIVMESKCSGPISETTPDCGIETPVCYYRTGGTWS